MSNWFSNTTKVDTLNRRTGEITIQSGVLLYLQDGAKISGKGLFIHANAKRTYWRPMVITQNLLNDSAQPVTSETLQKHKETILNELGNAPRMAIVFATANEKTVNKTFLFSQRTRIAWPEGDIVKFNREIPLQAIKDSGMLANVFLKLMEAHYVKVS